MAEVSINEFMTRLPLAFQPEKATGLDVTLQFILTGAEAGEWYAVIKDSKCSVTQGTTPSPEINSHDGFERFDEASDRPARWYAGLYVGENSPGWGYEPCDEDDESV